MNTVQRIFLYILLVLVCALPLVTAAEAVSATSLKFKRFGEAFSDFVFKIKAAFTFNEQNKVELMKQRDEELSVRQQAWLDVKAQVLSQFSNLTAEQKQELLAEIKAEHRDIIRDHVEATAEIREIELEAKSKGKTELVTQAAVAAEASEKSKLSLGLFALETGLDLLLESKADGQALTAAEAQVLVEKEFRVTATEVEVETENGVTVYEIEGEATETRGNFVLRKEVEAKVEARTGMIIAVEIKTKIVSKEEAEIRTEIGEEIKIESEGDVEEEASIKIDGSSKGRAGKTEAEAEGSASVVGVI